MEEVYIYPLDVSYNSRTKILQFDCITINSNKVQGRRKIKYLDYHYSFKLVSSKELTHAKIERYIKTVINDKYLSHEVSNGYNLFNPELNENFKPTYKFIYRIYIKTPLLKSEINRLNKKFQVIEENINYSKYKIQKDTGINLFNFTKVRVYKNNIVEILELDLDLKIPQLTTCCYDIETWFNPDENDFYSETHDDYIGSIVLKINDNKPIVLIINKNYQGKDIFKDYTRIVFKTEKDLLIYFIENYFNKVDVCYGYFNSGFDDLTIIQRYKTLFNKDLKLNTSVIRYDLQQYIKKTFSCPSYTLKDQLKKHFNNNFNKLDLDYNELQNIFNSYNNTQNIDELEKLIEYNIRDVEGTYKLEQKLNGFKNYLAISQITGVSINEFINKPLSSVILNYIYKILPNEIYIYNTNPNNKKYEGAYVDLTEDKKAFYKNVLPFDFKSLYPSMVMFYNLSPDTITTISNEEKVFKWTVDNQTYFFIKPEFYTGFLTNLMYELSNTRNKYKKLMKVDKVKYNPLQIAIKLIMNSIYGKLGEQIRTKNNFSISNRQLAQSITSLGQYNIKLLQTLLTGIIPENEYSLNYTTRSKDFLEIQEILKTSKFLYTDTDSVYIILDNDKFNITDIEVKYLSKLFKLPIYAEAEEKIKFINIVKKKYYIYETEDGKLHTKGWKRNEIKLLKDFHKDVFNDYRTIEEPIEKIIQDKFNLYKNIIKQDNTKLKSGNLTEEDKFNILQKYYINKQIKNQVHTLQDTNRFIKKCSTNLKKYTQEEKKEIQNKNINEVKEILKCNENDLGVISCRSNSPMYIFQYKQLKKPIKPRINCIQMKDYYSNKILNKIKSMNCVNTDILKENEIINLDETYYLNSLKSRIKHSILTTF